MSQAFPVIIFKADDTYIGIVFYRRKDVANSQSIFSYKMFDPNVESLEVKLRNAIVFLSERGLIIEPPIVYNFSPIEL